MSDAANQTRTAPPEGRAREASEKGAICVLLALAEPPAELLESLRLRAVTVVRQPSAFGAMAELIRLAGSSAPLILLVVEPDVVPRSMELARSVERFAPQAVCWRFDRAHKPSLRGFVPPVETPKAGSPPAHPVSRPNPQSEEPRLRLAGLEDPPPSAPGANGPRPGRVATETAQFAGKPVGADPESDRPADLLTEAELAMLLSNEPTDNGPLRGAEDR